jgi:hypothetical protein
MARKNPSSWLEGAGPFRTDPRKVGKNERCPACSIHFSPAELQPRACSNLTDCTGELLFGLFSGYSERGFEQESRFELVFSPGAKRLTQCPFALLFLFSTWQPVKSSFLRRTLSCGRSKRPANSLRADHRRVASDDPAIFLDHSHRWLPAIKLRGVQFTRGITHLLRVQPRVPAELRGALAIVITAGLFGGVRACGSWHSNIDVWWKRRADCRRFADLWRTGEVELQDSALFANPNFLRPGLKVEGNLLVNFPSGIGRREYLDANLGRPHEAGLGVCLLAASRREPRDVDGFNAVRG